MKVVIIGGVAGGASAAARLRRLDESAEIVMLERSGYVSYANCGLPYYVGGTIKEKRALTLQTPESFWGRFRIDARVRHEAVSIDPEARTVTVRRLADGSQYSETYDELILAPGAKPICPPLPGVGGSRVFTLRNVENALALRGFIQQSAPKRAVVVGGGYIGLEIAENLMQAGLSVTVVELAPQVLAPLDGDMAAIVQGYLRGQGVQLRLGAGVTAFQEGPGGLTASLSTGETLSADLAVMAVGVVPDTGLAKAAGLELGAKGSIVVDAEMRTSAPHIFAVGDAVQVKHLVTGQNTLISLAGPANRQGRIAADNICGIPSRYDSSQGSSVIKLFGLTVAATGVNGRQAAAANLAAEPVITLSASHATYYPGSSNITVKTLFEPHTGRLLGAQLIGFEGVEKRCDVLATALRAGMTCHDLAELELCYAPPYSSAKDPVNMAGFIMQNVLAGRVQQFHWEQLPAVLMDPSAGVLDVREEGEWAAGHLEGAVHIPLNELRERLAGLDAGKTWYVHCHSGLRSYIACRILSQNGIRCFNLSGGYGFYEAVQNGLDATPRHDCGAQIAGGRTL
ncbi:CoA-disulfide reductase [Oscillospiraceae bacterium]|nr:CoA-disulfide reductase [Oscillospiraceae bacterium]